MTVLEQLAVVAAFSVALMTALWFVQRRTGDAGIVDVGWSYALAASAIFAGVTGEGNQGQRILIAALAGIWGLRLGTHILTDRVLSGTEDGRYTDLRSHFGPEKIQRVLFVFYLVQAGFVIALCAPFLLAASNPNPLASPQYAGLGLFIFAKIGEWTADRQLKRFKRRADATGRTCRIGLWRYSRHPNYFFEWLMWCAYALIAFNAPYGWIGVFAPLFMLLLITKVTGIPPTEKRALRSRGEDYRRYQRTTSPFIPWFPKDDPEPQS
ncbi:MAG: DUF1295 domain-containing protein [Phycisphaerales bacterium]|nr:DUF1295 domain-containing protein [Phycisphaerales bacterium]